MAMDKAQMMHESLPVSSGVMPELTANLSRPVTPR